METEGNKLNIPSPAPSEGASISTTNGDLMDETTTTTVLASTVEAVPRAVSKSPMVKPQLVAAADAIDDRSNAYAPIVIDASPEPVVEKTASAATATTPPPRDRKSVV